MANKSPDQDQLKKMEKSQEPDEPVNFHHPFVPYDVQLEFMKTVYDVLEKGDGQVGILESPTGTGKSLSLICSAITWLRHNKRRRYEATYKTTAEQMAGEPDWVIEQALRRKREDIMRAWEDREKQLARIREKERVLEERAAKRQRVGDSHQKSKRGKDAAAVDEEEEEAEFLVRDWDAGGGGGGGEEREGGGGGGAGLGDAMKKVLLSGVVNPGLAADEEDAELEDEVKIYYTSRTHSQLTQFVSELRRPNFPPSIPSDLLSSRQVDKEEASSTEIVKELPLSSRQKLCINPSVSRLGSLSAINDRCAELQQAKSHNRCSFMPNAENLRLTHEFRDAALATVPDIEDLYQTGKKMQICPYYASRTAIPGAEVVTLPYPLLLQKSAREALGIKLEGNIVIIDEAHNIMDAVASVHAAEIRLGELRRCRQMLGVYVRRFVKKLKGENRVMVAQLGKVVESLTGWLDGALKNKTRQGTTDPNLLLKGRGADQIDLFKLIRYIQESKLAYKVESYASHVEEQDTPAATPKQGPPSSTPVLHTLTSFLLALTNLSTEGRIFYEPIQSGTPDAKLSYLLLSPTHAFSSIASSARAIILAGGTMSPFDDYRTHLFPQLAPERITTLSCGHVIPASNLCVWTLTSPRPIPSAATTTAVGASGSTDTSFFDFSFQKRGDRAMIHQLGLAILNICAVVPDGVVVFFPSYGYLDQVVAAWQTPPPAADASSDRRPLWERLQGKKTVFRETKDGSSDEVLQSYTDAILGGATSSTESQPAKTSGNSGSGALLLSVVGGKMSEGINFSDRLGRCVVIVGLPYPNMHSPEWRARVEYIEGTALSRLLQIQSAGDTNTDIDPDPKTAAAAKQAARDFYENACMRAVNQSIGRAIRHRGDYAAIVLLDRRFGAERIRAKLPGWIRGGMVAGCEARGVPGLMGALSGFFRGKKGGGL